MCPEVSWVAFNPLLKRLCRFLQFPAYNLIVLGGDFQLFALAEVFKSMRDLIQSALRFVHLFAQLFNFAA